MLNLSLGKTFTDPHIYLDNVPYTMDQIKLLSDGKEVKPSQDNDLDEILETDLTLVFNGRKIPFTMEDIPEEMEETIYQMIYPT